MVANYHPASPAYLVAMNGDPRKGEVSSAPGLVEFAVVIGLANLGR
jgi:hypothetical protein